MFVIRNKDGEFYTGDKHRGKNNRTAIFSAHIHEAKPFRSLYLCERAANLLNQKDNRNDYYGLEYKYVV